MRDRIKSVESILSAVGEDNHEGGKKNQYLLLVTTFLFTAFVVAEIIGALAGNSLALLGDASAMSVDIFSYICSWYGERVKARNDGVLDEGTRLLVEVYIPLFSLIALMTVSGYVCSDAIMILLHPENVEDDVSVVFLYGFAGANMVVDIISISLFYFQRHALFKKVADKDGDLDNSSLSSAATEALLVSDDEICAVEQNTLANASALYSPPPNANVDQDLDHATSSDGRHIDINMASALTHVGGDSIRTAAVFISAVITSCGVNGSLCDAWATVAVTVSIVAMVIPLTKEINHAFWKRNPPKISIKSSTAYDRLYKDSLRLSGSSEGRY